MLGTTSKAASVAVSAPASAASHLEAPVSCNSSGSSDPKLQTAGTAATEQPGDRARVKAETARRYAYSELDQMARKTLAEIDWSWTSSHEECKDILEAFYEYQRSNEFAPKVLNLSAVVVEIQLTVQYFSRERLWPDWVLQPNDALLKRLPDDHDSYVDYGNEMWEVMVNLMNLSAVMESVWHQETFNAAPHAQYGDRVNRSSVGSYNLRGNVVERLLTLLFKKRRQEPRENGGRRA